MLNKTKIINFLILACMLSTSAIAQEFYLECDGVASVKIDNDTTIGFDYSTMITTTSEEKLREIVRIDINKTEEKIKIPNSFIRGLEKLSTSAKDGWYEIKDLEVNENEIKGKFKLGIIFSPKFLVSRYTGDISIKGNGKSFIGACKKLDKPTEQLF